jgi:cytochrome c-type biogenesis protein CcmH/NrfG
LWFALGLACEDLHDTHGAIEAYRRSAQLRPEVPETHVNLGLNLQQSGDLKAAMDSYGRAVRLRPDAFGRVSQALTSAKKGQLWLDLGRLRRSFGD